MIGGEDSITMAIHAKANYQRALESHDELTSNRAVRARAFAELADRLVSSGAVWAGSTTLLDIVAGVILEAVNEEAVLVSKQMKVDFDQACSAFQNGVLAAVDRAVRSIRP
jgi:hypothetical protein